jgi:acetoin utilization deacetylase AcuC-like enzyme
MTTLLVSHPACLDHLTPAGHPERPDRLRALAQALQDERFDALVRAEAPRAEVEMIALAHPRAYVEAIADATPKEGLVRLDGDTTLSPGSYEAAARAAGGAVFAVDEVMAGKVTNAFVATRPPGHHAEAATPMGFCLFNNVAVAARHARKHHGVERVAIVDFDVHHGNGSQEIFWSDPAVMYASTHEMPLYPGTGAKSERGAYGNIVNAPLSAGDGGEKLQAAFNDTIMPALRNFGPDLLLVSAGFDAHARDPLANLNLDASDFAWVTRQLVAFARAGAGARIVSVLEGGYDLQGLSESAAAHVAALMEA